MHNKDIDHLYSVSQIEGGQNKEPGQFSMDTIRMKANLGLAGRAFSTGAIVVEENASDPKFLIVEEKDLSKLKIITGSLNNALAVPVMEKQSGLPSAVV